jgi:glycerol-3-phosphate dehydrogenase
MIDVTIIGAGIIGSAIAHSLSKYKLNVLVLEKEIEVSNGVTKANSAIIHAGNDPEPNTLKAKLNVLGNKMVQEICQELNVDFKKTGSLTVAYSDEQVDMIHKLYERGIENGAHVEILDREELLKREPNLKDDVQIGLYAPETGILAPWDLVYAFLENAIENGVQVKTNEEVKSINKKDFGFEVVTNNDTYETRYVINAAGLFAKNITSMVTSDPGFNMIPTRGQYYVLDRDVEGYMNHVIYPTPTSKGKGVLVVPTIHGNTLLGPTADYIEDVDGNEVTKPGFTYIRHHLEDMVKNIPYKSNIRTFAGVRPKTDRHDFIIEEVKDVPNFIQCAGIESPGLASSPAIAKYVEDILLNKEKFELDENYHVYRQKNLKIKELAPEAVNELVKENPLYGRVICRCEQITEGEIVDAIHRPMGARTLDGIKRRTRPGSGRCQGGFCQPLVTRIMARELKQELTEILLDKANSNVLVAETKTGGEVHE